VTAHLIQSHRNFQKVSESRSLFVSVRREGRITTWWCKETSRTIGAWNAYSVILFSAFSE